MNTKLGMKVNIYFEWENKSQQMINFKKPTNTTNIIESRRIAQYFY